MALNDREVVREDDLGGLQKSGQRQASVGCSGGDSGRRGGRQRQQEALSVGVFRKRAPKCIKERRVSVFEEVG
jgi:hypothetical protein